MQNLLRTLTESQVKSPSHQSDLKLLLSTVKEGRVGLIFLSGSYLIVSHFSGHQSYDAKLSDPFYDSLEGLLLDLRTVTMVLVVYRSGVCTLLNCGTRITATPRRS
jgi:transcriptional activator SPT7